MEFFRSSEKALCKGTAETSARTTSAWQPLLHAFSFTISFPLSDHVALVPDLVTSFFPLLLFAWTKPT